MVLPEEGWVAAIRLMMTKGICRSELFVNMPNGIILIDGGISICMLTVSGVDRGAEKERPRRRWRVSGSELESWIRGRSS